MIWLSRVLTVSRATPTTMRIVVPPMLIPLREGTISARMIGNIAMIPRKIAPIRVILLREL